MTTTLSKRSQEHFEFHNNNQFLLAYSTVGVAGSGFALDFLLARNILPGSNKMDYCIRKQYRCLRIADRMSEIYGVSSTPGQREERHVSGLDALGE